MDLRPELMPPMLDGDLVGRLARLADRMDGAYPGAWEEDLIEFNRLAGTELQIEEFQEIYAGEDHADWVRRLLRRQLIKPLENVTEAELVEIVRRAMPQNGDPDYQAYMVILEANVPLPSAANLIFYPRDYEPATNTWAGGRPIADYDPSPEQIVNWALQKD